MGGGFCNHYLLLKMRVGEMFKSVVETRISQGLKVYIQDSYWYSFLCAINLKLITLIF